jgi:hypothetical protein
VCKGCGKVTILLSFGEKRFEPRLRREAFELTKFEPSQHFHHLITPIFVWPKPYKDRHLAENFAHEIELSSLLVVIVLIDAYSIDPENTTSNIVTG